VTRKRKRLKTLKLVLDPLLGRVLIKKGKAIRLGDKEIEYHPLFQLFLHTKLANPHYKPGKRALVALILISCAVIDVYGI
jgi:dynein heavy chain